MSDLEKLLAEATPGPWNAHPSTPEDGYECFWIVARKPMGLATHGFSIVDIATADGPQNETRKANARLIALAPSLAAALLVAEKALRDIDDRIEKAASCHHNADEWDDRTLDGDLTIMDWVMSPVRAALSEIAKLTGGGE